MPRKQLWLTAIFSTAGFLLLYRASSVTGLHPDEAWSFLRVEEIARGARPVQGMNSYTGPSFQYVLWPIFALFGATIRTLRITSAFFGLGTLGLWMWLLSFADPRRLVGLRQGLVLATLPAFVLFSRFATEITTLVPFLCSLGLALFWRAQMLERWPLAVGAGFVFALAAYYPCFGHLLSGGPGDCLSREYTEGQSWPQAPDPRSDVRSFCCRLFELCTFAPL
jgi:4-amino-4-deoxy-L-arabinose transferase-like glycosyltransferase